MKMRMFDNIVASEVQDVSILKAKSILEEMDPLALHCLYMSACHSQSAAVSLLHLNGLISSEEATRASRIEEDFQTSRNGFVEGAHDLEEV